MMPDRQYGKAEHYEPYRGLKSFIGAALIFVGVVVALWTVVNVYNLFTSPQGLEIFKQIIPDTPEARELDVDGTKVMLPPGIFLFMSYCIGCFLLFIAANIGAALISGGVNLLQSNLQKLEAKISKEIGSLKRTFEETKERLVKKSDT